MSEPTLQLSEHELYFLPPGTPAIAPATRVEVEIDGEKRWFLARSELYPSPSQSGGSISLLFCAEEDANDIVFGKQSWIDKNPKNKTQQEIVQEVSILVQSKRAGRCRFWCSPDEKFGVVFRSSGTAFLHFSDVTTSVGSVGFRWDEGEQKEDFSNWSQGSFLEFCRQLAEDESSPLKYALYWKFLDPQQRDAVAFHCGNGEWETLRQCFLLAAKIVSYRCGVFPAPVPIRDASYWRIDLPFWPTQNYSLALKSSTRWRIALCQIFLPAFYKDEPLCVKDWRSKKPNLARCVVECTMPTAHEFLEAQLELREFLRPHLADDEIEALMRPN